MQPVFISDNCFAHIGIRANEIKICSTPPKCLKTHKSFSCLVSVPQTSRLVSGLETGDIYVWNTDSQKIEKTIVGHTSNIYLLACSEDGKYLLSASRDFTLRLWDLHTGMCMQVFPQKDTIKGISFLSTYISAINSKGKLTVWDMHGSIIEECEKFGEIFGAAYSPNGEYLAIGTQNAINLYKVLSKDKPHLWEYKIDIEKPRHIVYGRYIAVYVASSDVSIIDPHTGQCISELSSILRNGRTSIAFSPDGRLLVLIKNRIATCVYNLDKIPYHKFNRFVTYITGLKTYDPKFLAKIRGMLLKK